MSRRYRLAFLETICNSRSQRGLGSHGLTNAGKKASSVKGSLKYSNIKADDTAGLRMNYRYVKPVKHNTMFRNLDAARTGARNDSHTGRAVSFDDESQFNNSHKHSLKELGHQELFRAEKKHALRCMAENGHVCDRACAISNIADIPSRYKNKRGQILHANRKQLNRSTNSLDNCSYSSDQINVGDFV